jgi:hypothetical protein
MAFSVRAVRPTAYSLKLFLFPTCARLGHLRIYDRQVIRQLPIQFFHFIRHFPRKIVEFARVF